MYMYMYVGGCTCTNLWDNECTHSAEPSPQMWFGKQEWFCHWQEITFDCKNKLLQLLYWDYIIFVCALQLTFQVLLYKIT